MRFEKLTYEEAVKATIDAGYTPTPNLKHALQSLEMPSRATQNSAGYDFHSAYDVVVKKGHSVKIPLLIKVTNMPRNVVLLIFNRSGLSLKKGLRLENAVGVVDSDFEQGIMFQATAETEDVIISQGDRICQGVFLNFLTVQDDQAGGRRKGGFGSTGR